MSSIEALKAKVQQLEEELAIEKSRNSQNAPARGKISQMSSEVVDSNPYRLVIRGLYLQFFEMFCMSYSFKSKSGDENLSHYFLN